HCLFLIDNGTVWICGQNYAWQLGHSEKSLAPIPNLANIIQVAAGHGHSCFLHRDGTIWNCGNNTAGQLGRINENHYKVGQLKVLTDVIRITCGRFNSSFIKGDGSVWACGYNNGLTDAELRGSNTKVNLAVADIPPVRRIVEGYLNAVVFMADGSIYAYGLHDNGEILRPSSDRRPNVGPVALENTPIGRPTTDYEPGTLLIQHNTKHFKPAVKVYDDGRNQITLAPELVYQVEGNEAIPKDFELRGVNP
ncbi:MAG: hypothetical protein LUE17_00280, partial [Planctomycetaceae bacterium]|nr:hypothetical protein [Planctomycetaceae bacterium]